MTIGDALRKSIQPISLFNREPEDFLIFRQVFIHVDMSRHRLPIDQLEVNANALKASEEKAVEHLPESARVPATDVVGEAREMGGVVHGVSVLCAGARSLPVGNNIGAPGAMAGDVQHGRNFWVYADDERVGLIVEVVPTHKV